MKRIILSGEQRSAIESTLEDLKSAQRGFESARTERDSLRTASEANDAAIGKLQDSADPKDDKAVLALIVSERRSPLLAERLDASQVAMNEAFGNVAGVARRVPELLQQVLSPVFDQVVSDTIHELMPGFGEPQLARAAALQTARVRRFSSFLACGWVGADAGKTAPLAVRWFENLLDGTLPTELSA